MASDVWLWELDDPTKLKLGQHTQFNTPSIKTAEYTQWALVKFFFLTCPSGDKQQVH